MCASVSAFVFGGKLFSAGVLAKVISVENIYLACGVSNVPSIISVSLTNRLVFLSVVEWGGCSNRPCDSSMHVLLCEFLSPIDNH